MDTEKTTDKQTAGAQKNNLRKRLYSKKLFLVRFLQEAARGEYSYGRLVDKLISVVKVFIAATQKFMEDRCLSKAASFTYTLIISIIPTLTVCLTVYALFAGADDKKNELFAEISSFMVENNIELNIEPIFDAISSLVENAGKVGGISAVVMLFSATAMLRSFEKSLNDIYKVQRQRRIVLKIVYYWSALTLCPVMVTAAATITKQMSDTFSPPNFTSIYVQDDRLWLTGSKGSIRYGKGGSTDLKSVTEDMINFDGQMVYVYDGSDQSFVQTDSEIEMDELKKIKFSDIQFTGFHGWAVGEQGLILETENSGESWVIRKWGGFRLNAIHMLNDTDGFVAADNGFILFTRDGGKSWNVLKWKEVTANLKSVAFSGRRGIITGDSGTIIQSYDSGRTWQPQKLNEAKGATIASVCFTEDDAIWLTCEGGLILKSVNGGVSWQTMSFKRFSYNSGLFTSKSLGMAAGSKGRLIATEDGGKNWSVRRLPTSSINALVQNGGMLWAAGDRGMLMFSSDNGKTWEGRKGQSLAAFCINFSAPFVFIWLLFFLCYTVFPNTKVQMKEAGIGAAFTSAVWCIFILLFLVYIRSFAKGTFAIYGALAAIPLFLLMVYASTIIVLYGAEVSYTLMHPDTYAKISKGAVSDRKIFHVYYGIAVLSGIYKKFEDGKGGSDYKELSELCSNNSEEADFFLNKFVEDGLIFQSRQGYIPANASKNIKLSDIINSVYEISLAIPKGVRKSPIRDYMDGVFKRLKESRATVTGDTTLKDLIGE